MLNNVSIKYFYLLHIQCFFFFLFFYFQQTRVLQIRVRSVPPKYSRYTSTKDRDRISAGGGGGVKNGTSGAVNGANAKIWKDNNIKALPLKVNVENKNI